MKVGKGVVIMLDIAEMKKLLKVSLPHKRFKHSLAVYDTALELAEIRKRLAWVRYCMIVDVKYLHVIF